jgi:hypothetical protein
MTSLEGEPQLALRPGATAWRDVGDSVVALDIDAGEYLDLNPTAAALWRRLADGTTVAALTDELRGSFDVGEAEAEADVRSFLDALRARGLVAGEPSG